MTILKSEAKLIAVRDAAKVNIDNLIEWHRGRIKEIDAGHQYYKAGVNITTEMRLRHGREISMCEAVKAAMDHMKAGDIQRAAKLCSEIQGQLPSLAV